MSCPTRLTWRCPGCGSLQHCTCRPACAEESCAYSPRLCRSCRLARLAAARRRRLARRGCSWCSPFSQRPGPCPECLPALDEWADREMALEERRIA